MTIGTTVSSVTAQGNGATTLFDYDFLIPTSNDVLITIADTTVDPATNTALLSSEYTITGLNDPNGGQVQYPLAGDPLAAGQYITITRTLPFIQATQISNQGNFYPAVVEAALDYQMMCIQQLGALIASQGLVTAVGLLGDPPISVAYSGGIYTISFEGTGVAFTDVANIFTQNQTIRSDDSSAAAAPALTLDRNSATPQASDLLGLFSSTGRNTGGGTIPYADWVGRINDPTSSAEVGDFVIRTVAAGVPAERGYIRAGLVMGSPVGNDQGAGTGNFAGGVYDNGVRLTNASGGSATSNLLINGGMQVNQRVVTTGAADDTYCLDRWYLLLQTAAITIAQQTLQENGTPTNIRLTQAQVASQRMGIAQIVEAQNSQPCRGQAMAMNARVRISATSQTVRYAILEWTGTADTVTSDVVLDWTSGSYTAGGFFLASNLTVTAVGSLALTANTWTTLTTLTGTCGSLTNNLIVFIWTEGAQAQNVTLDISRVQCGIGAGSSTFAWQDIAATLQQCQRYYQKSFNQTQKPVQGGTFALGSAFAPQVVGASTTNSGGMNIIYPVTMRQGAGLAPPVLYGVGSAQAFNITIAANCTGTTASVWAENGFLVTFISPAASAAGNVIAVNWSMEAEL